MNPTYRFSRLCGALVLACAVLSGCGPAQGPGTPGPPWVDALDSLGVISEVTDAVAAFHFADTTRNPSAVSRLIWPEFSMLADGNRVDHAAAVAGAHAFLPTLRTFHTEWTDLEIVPLSEDLAISSFTFRDSIVTLSGELTQQQGPNTFVWQRRNGEWRVLYADADHYPIDDR